MVGLELATLQLAVKLQRFNCSVTKPHPIDRLVQGGMTGMRQHIHNTSQRIKSCEKDQTADRARLPAR